MEPVIAMPPIVASSPPLGGGRRIAHAPSPVPPSSSTPPMVVINATETPPPTLPPGSSPTTTTTTTTSATKTSTRPRRRVTIELSRNETHVLEENLCSCANDIWYEPDHFVTMKAMGKCDAREGRRLGLGALLEGTFGAVPAEDAQDRIAAYCRLEGGSSSSSSPPSGAGEGADSLRYSASRRGLERSLSRRHGDERSEQKDRARRAVLIHQSSLTRQGVKPDELWQRIAAVYMKHCRPAKVYARRFGIGDELAVSSEEPTDDPNLSSAVPRNEAYRLLSTALDGTERGNSFVKASLRLLDDSSGPGGGFRAPRRFSNASLASSIHSVNSYDSNRRFCGGGDRSRALPKRTSSRTCPLDSPTRSSPSPSSTSHSSSSSSDELYVAAIA